MNTIKNIYSLFIRAGFYLICFLILNDSAKSQSRENANIYATSDREINIEAMELYNEGFYEAALPKILTIYKKHPEITSTNYQLGVCYLKTNINKALSIPYFKYCLTQKDAPKECLYQLGLAYLADEKITEAKEAFNTFISNRKGKSEFITNAARQIEMCENAEFFMKHPLQLTITNLGKQINSNYAEYNPFITPDESILIFTSRRKTNIGGYINKNGEYPADIYTSTIKDGVWTKAKNAGGLINTAYDEECVGITQDGNQILIYIDNMDAYGDLYTSNIKGISWQRPVSFDKTINTKDYETGGSLSPDGNTLIFSSNRIKEGYGGYDLYISKKLPSCEWSKPQNLGPLVNTNYDEESPSFFADGQTIFFSSDGHKSMGGKDIFRTRFKKETQTWSEPENLGYPINNTLDNNSFSITADGKFAYVSAIEKKGEGNLDIYKISFSGIEIPGNYSVIKASLSPTDLARSANIEISFTDIQNNEMQGVYNVNKNSGKFIVIANPGKYLMNVNVQGYQPYQEEFLIEESEHPVEIFRKIIPKKNE